MTVFAIPAAIFRALFQISDPQFQRILLRSVMLACVLLLLASVGGAWLLGLLPDILPLIGDVPWLARLLAYGSFLLLLWVSFFLVVPVARIVLSLYLDGVIERVEQRHYPLLAPTAGASLSSEILSGLKFFGLFIAAHLIALLPYLLFPFWAPLIFLCLNGFLLGRECFTQVAIRRIERKRIQALADRHWFVLLLTGVLLSIPLYIPLLGLLVPVFAAAVFTHIFHSLVKMQEDSEEGAAAA